MDATSIDADTRRSVELCLDRYRHEYSVAGAYLFGSRARGDHQADSDADVAVILDGPKGRAVSVACDMAGAEFDVMLETGIDGQPLYRLRADRIEQPNPAANIELTAPQFQYEGTTVWTVTALSGVVPPTQQQIKLSGDVLARADRVGAEPMQLHSATLSVDMQTRRADTVDAVTMDWGTNRLWAAGLHADMQADYLLLKSPVHGEFSRLAQ